MVQPDHSMAYKCLEASLDCLEMSRVQIDLGAVGHMQILVH